MSIARVRMNLNATNQRQWQSQIHLPNPCRLSARNLSGLSRKLNLPISSSPSTISYSLSLRLSVRFRSGAPFRRCTSAEIPESDSDSGQSYVSEPIETVQQEKISIVNVLKNANSFLPHVVLASTLLALIYPPSFTWFTTSEKDFLEAFKKPAAILTGYVGQYLVKPMLGYFFGIVSVVVFGLPTPIGAGIMLVSCVSGAQLSNYATFLTDPTMAPLSIVMTSLSTATAVVVTPLLSLLLIGKRLPVDVKGMVSSILQIVVTPIAAGLFLNRFFPRISDAIRPFLPPLSVIVTALCVGAPLALNIKSVLSPFGVVVLLLICAFHASAFITGYAFTGIAFRMAPDVKALQRTLSYETGMQSSLLALALANRFFQDPLVGIPPAISTVIMSLMGFSLVTVWSKRKDQLC
ncbi:probable sodium/metabolite cotransporter BASS6, chloroplastic isoform X2 [Ziziphus jujuba]|uniref:Probable sodium/metabolite cotransporter BASS6, chloroplastic isoform X2 n=1 Tax=Ziziphus jujuba TaxID=326968 RepID=A0ABM3I3M8_ZIZJJ|nr:probable sodium/metabolite cotransporter BASS6, chloroplastic isoform X2 [Ziziphus jujuba]